MSIIEGLKKRSLNESLTGKPHSTFFSASRKSEKPITRGVRLPASLMTKTTVLD
jgi:hypothetical protein